MIVCTASDHRGVACPSQDEERVFAGRKMTREETRELEKKKEVLRLARDYNATTVDKSQRYVNACFVASDYCWCCNFCSGSGSLCCYFTILLS